MKYIITSLLIGLLVLSCNQTKEHFNKSNTIKSTQQIIDPLTIISKEELEEIESFALNYYIQRTNSSSLYKRDLFKDVNLQNYLSEYFEIIGKEDSQSTFVITDKISVIQSELITNSILGYKDNIGVLADIFRISLSIPIAGRIENHKYIKDQNNHNVYVLVIKNKNKLEILGDSDLLWFNKTDSYDLANLYIYEKDIVSFNKDK